jgi:DNA-binding PadR family transcriptional regulator
VVARKKGKAKPGTWVTREMVNSRAYWKLIGTAKGLLMLFLLKRDMDKQHNCLNKNNITMTYLELENLFVSNGQNKIGGVAIARNLTGYKDGLSRASIARAIKDLMAKGFIPLIHHGGTYKKDKSIYGLTDDWMRWTPGAVLYEKPPGKRVNDSLMRKKSQDTQKQEAPV